MAIYQVNKDGYTPSHAKPGDYIATGGGTYQILDPSMYSGMSKKELAKAGVGYNESSGLYSKKVTDPTDPYYANTGVGGTNYENLVNRHTGVENWDPLTYSTADQWKQKYIEGQVAQLQQNYDDNLASLKKNYNKNVALGEQELNNVDASYEQNLQNLYDDAYLQRKLAVQNASRNGITSTAQAQAASNALLYKASDSAADLTSDRDVLKSNIRSELNRLAEDYNIDKDTLKKNFDSAKLNAMSTGELQYLEQVLKIDEYNANLWNSLTTAKTERDWQAAQAEKDRQWQSAEAQKDRDFQMLLQQMYSGSNYGNNDPSDYEDKDVTDLVYALEYETVNVPESEKEYFATLIAGVEAGRYTKSEVANLINNSIKKWNYAANHPGSTHKNNVLVNNYDKYNVSQIR